MAEFTIKDLKKIYQSLSPLPTNKRCAYCSAMAVDKEHVLPKSWLNSLISMQSGGVEVEIPEMLIVPACRECNSLASSLVFKNFIEKRKYIAKRIRTRYRRLIRGKDWTNEEMNELSGRLKEYIYYSMQIKKLVEQRLEALDGKLEFNIDYRYE